MLSHACVQGRHGSREDMAHRRYDAQRQGNPHQREHNAEHTSRERRRYNVTVTCETKEDNLTLGTNHKRTQSFLRNK